MFQHIVHITTRQEWEAAQASGEYRPAAFERDGFVHCSTPDQVLEVANSYYRGQTGLVLLRIEPRRLKAEVCYENLDGGKLLFPHVYGPIEVAAVDAVLDLEPGDDGSFAMPVVAAPAAGWLD